MDSNNVKKIWNVVFYFQTKLTVCVFYIVF